MPEKLAICLLASEVEPLSKTGGLADVSGALTKYLHGAGHDVRLFTPCYASIDRAAYAAQPVEGLQQVPLAVGPNNYVFSVLRAQLPGGAPVYLIDCPALYARTAIYTSDPDEHLRFLGFTRAALVACQRLAWAPQVLHCNDWHTAFAPLFLKTVWEDEPLFAATRTVLTIHNIGYQGIFPTARIADLGLPGRRSLLHQDDLAAGRINALRHGILYADSITTVSPTHAREICTDEYGMGLQDSLRARARARAVSGILNGVDYDEWDPRHDRYLPADYDAGRLAVKGELKGQFARRQKLTAAPDVPLAGLVSRLAVQKGIELMFEALPKVLSARPLSLVALSPSSSAASPGASCFTAVTTRSSRTGSRRRAICFSCPRATSRAGSTRCTAFATVRCRSCAAPAGSPIRSSTTAPKPASAPGWCSTISTPRLWSGR